MTVWFAVKVLLHENAMLVLIVSLTILLVAGGEQQPFTLAELPLASSSRSLLHAAVRARLARVLLDGFNMGDTFVRIHCRLW
jgi:hypothetical protein